MTDIETNIPLPPPKEPAYPCLYTMPVGSSFAKGIDERQALHYAVQYAQRSTRDTEKLRFATRTDDRTQTVRVWRLE
jgi:hypothetical protein